MQILNDHVKNKNTWVVDFYGFGFITEAFLTQSKKTR